MTSSFMEEALKSRNYNNSEIYIAPNINTHNLPQSKSRNELNYSIESNNRSFIAAKNFEEKLNKEVTSNDESDNNKKQLKESLIKKQSDEVLQLDKRITQINELENKFTSNFLIVNLLLELFLLLLILFIVFLLPEVFFNKSREANSPEYISFQILEFSYVNKNVKVENWLNCFHTNSCSVILESDLINYNMTLSNVQNIFISGIIVSLFRI